MIDEGSRNFKKKDLDTVGVRAAHAEGAASRLDTTPPLVHSPESGQVWLRRRAIDMQIWAEYSMCNPIYISSQYVTHTTAELSQAEQLRNLPLGMAAARLVAGLAQSPTAETT